MVFFALAPRALSNPLGALRPELGSDNSLAVSRGDLAGEASTRTLLPPFSLTSF